ncbi:MAG TPA: hypothetical protein VEX12_08140 [Microbacterium sp.]|nr:hypothetical protein [Microbacterium sp.]
MGSTILPFEHLRSGVAHDRLGLAPKPARSGQHCQQLVVAAVPQPVGRERRVGCIRQGIAERVECAGEVHHASILARASDIQRPRSEAHNSSG